MNFRQYRCNGYIIMTQLWEFCQWKLGISLVKLAWKLGILQDVCPITVNNIKHHKAPQLAIWYLNWLQRESYPVQR